MPEKLAADWLAHQQGRNPKTAKQADAELRRFKQTKHNYKLKSHKPNLIKLIKPTGDLDFTPEGDELLTAVLRSE